MTMRDEDYVPIPSDTAGGGSRTIWVLFLGTPTIWITHFMAVYVLGEVLCKPLLTDAVVAGLPLVSFLTLAATVVAAGASGVLTMLSYRRWRAAGNSTAQSSAQDDVTRSREEVLAFAGTLLGMLFFVAVLFTGAPAIVVQPC